MPTNYRAWLVWATLMLLPALACTLSLPGDGATDTPPPAAVTPVVTATPLPAQPPFDTDSSGWQQIAPGIEQRTLELAVSGFNPETVMVRLDPALVTFRVHYRPGDPLSLTEWGAQLPDAHLIVNGGFFNESDFATALVVSDGVASGASYTGFGGMFQVVGGGVTVRSLASQPYAGEALTQAVQSFPMLIEHDGVLAPRGAGFDQRSRRTFIAQDRAGRIIIGAIPYGTVSFAGLQDGLLASDLNIAVALALDGGRSTGLLLRMGEAVQNYPALSPLPLVIAAYAPG